MKLKELVKKARKFAKPYRVTDGDKFRLKDFDPGDTQEFDSEDKPRSKEALAVGVEALAGMQDMLYAQDKWAVLLIFQAMDAAGKDGAIKHVMSGVNPQGCEVHSFKSPSSEDLDHDYLWRCMKDLPNRGRIGIFNRSYYEETLVVRVHPELLEKQKLPRERITKDIWKERFQDIRAFERYLGRNGVIIRKFFLHVSKKEQKKRFLERIENPGEELEVLLERRQGARVLGRLHGGLRGHDPRDRHQGGAVVCRARGQQMVHPRGGGRGGHRGAGFAGPAIPEGREGKAGGTGRCQSGSPGKQEKVAGPDFIPEAAR